MFKKLISMVAATAALMVSALNVSPAQAAGAATLPYRFDIVSLKALSSNRAFVLGYVPSGSYKDLVGYSIADDGTIGDPIVFETGARMAYNSIEVSPVTALSDGTYALAWTAYNSVTGSSTINARFSADGSNWGVISHPAPALTSSSCSGGGAAYCYYVTPAIAQDGKGKVAVAFAKKAESWKALVSVSADKSTWANPLVQSQNTSNTKISFIYGLSAGGFEAGGTVCSIATCSLWISTIDPKATKFTTQGRLEPKWGSNVSYAIFDRVQTINGTTAVIPIASISNDFAFSWLTFSTVTGKWSTIKTLKVPGSSTYYKSPVSTFDVEGRLTYVFASPALDTSRNATGRDNYLKLVFDPISLAVSTQLIGDAPSDAFGRITYLRNLYFDADNQLHLVMDKGGELSAVDAVLTQAGLNDSQTITLLRSGEKYFAVTTTSGNQISTVTSDGSIYYSDDANYVQTIRQADKPRLTSNLVVTGKNQKGSTLTATTPTFIGNGAVESITYDWYACKAALTTLTFGSTPANCVLVSVGSSKTYKLKPTDAGKFVSVAATGHNGSLTTVVFSKTTAKVK